MGDYIMVIIACIILAVSIGLIILSCKTKSKNIEKISAIGTVLAVIVAVLPYFKAIPIGNGNEMKLYIGKSEKLEKMEENYARTIEENAQLKVDLNDKEKEIQKLNSEVDSLEAELTELRESAKYNATFKNYSLTMDGNPVTVNQDNAFAVVNSKLYFSEDAVAAITQNEVNQDNDNNILYIGKYPEKKVDLLSACEPFDPTNGFRLGKDNPYKIQSKTYSDGFYLETDHSDSRSVRFNLGGKYTELTFNIGHVDETNKNGSFILTAYLDGEEEVAKQIICDVNTDIDIEQSVPLNNAKILILEWRGDDVLYTTYGLTNIKLK